MATVTTQASILQTGFRQQISFGIGQSQIVPVPLVLKQVFGVSGALADQCRYLYCPPTIAFAASTPQTLDLTALTDIFGAAFGFAGVRVAIFRNNSVVDADLFQAGNAGANEWAGLCSNLATVPLYPSTAANDGFVMYQMPNLTGAVVDSTHKLLKIDPGTLAKGLDLLIAGF